MSAQRTELGLGVGWRPEMALAIERETRLGFIEITAENHPNPAKLSPALLDLRARGMKMIVHGIGLSLGGAEPIEPRRVAHLDALARALNAPLVSEHICFVRAGGIESGHLLPVPRTREALNALIENIRAAQALLSVPLALENISTLFEWPKPEIDEAEFISEILEKTGALLLLDVANVYANARNLGGDQVRLIERLPLNKIAYVHMGGGHEHDGIYHDTHGGDVPEGALKLLEELSARTALPGVMLERDDDYPDADGLGRELGRIQAAVEAGRNRG